MKVLLDPGIGISTLDQSKLGDGSEDISELGGDILVPLRKFQEAFCNGPLMPKTTSLSLQVHIDVWNELDYNFSSCFWDY